MVVSLCGSGVALEIGWQIRVGTSSILPQGDRTMTVAAMNDGWQWRNSPRSLAGDPSTIQTLPGVKRKREELSRRSVTSVTRLSR
jgi:hypothetical protein